MILGVDETLDLIHRLLSLYVPNSLDRQNVFERGKPVTVLIRWNGKGPRNVLIKRLDGSRVVRPFRGLRKPPEEAAGKL